MKLKDALNIVFERVIGQNTVDSADMEGMGGGGGLVVKSEVSGEDFVLDKTWKEIKDAFASGGSVIIDISAQFNDDQVQFSAVAVMSVMISDGSYYVSTGDYQYLTDSEDGYPKTVGSEDDAM